MSELSCFSGETLSFTVEPQNADGSAYTLAAGDKIIFSVAKWEHKRSEPVLTRELTAADYDVSGNLTITLTAEDTAEIAPGVYKFDCGLQTAAGEFYIFIKPSNFVVKQAISQKEEE